MSTEESKKSKGLVTHEIIISKSNAELTDPAYGLSRAPSLGYGDVYEFRHADGSPAGNGKTACSGDTISFGCNQAFTFLAAERGHWQSLDGKPLVWRQLLLQDGSAFAALNSNTTPMSGSVKFRLDLVVVKDSNCKLPPGYDITIPQLNLPLWPDYSVMGGTQPPPPNPVFVRSSVNLQ